MLTRRHVRVKVMQCIYALTRSNDALYLLLLSLIKEIHLLAKEQVELSSNTYLTNTTDKFPDKSKFVNNSFLNLISNNKALQEELEIRKLKNWYLNDEYVKLLY